MEINIKSFTATLDIPVQIKSKTSNFWDYNGHQCWALINIDHGMAAIGHSRSTDGGMSYQWSYIGTYGVRDVKGGLQYFDPSLSTWKFFDDDVQEAYAQYALEKELK